MLDSAKINQTIHSNKQTKKDTYNWSTCTIFSLFKCYDLCLSQQRLIKLHSQTNKQKRIMQLKYMYYFFFIYLSAYTHKNRSISVITQFWSPFSKYFPKKKQ
jgi:hypothetical protein